MLASMRAHLRQRIDLPRWVLTLIYSLTLPLAAAIIWATSPSLDEFFASIEWMTPVWAAALGLTGAVTAIGSLREEWEALERWSSLGLACLLVFYAFSPLWLVIQGDADRAVYSMTAFMIMVMPWWRTIGLLRRTGLKPGQPIPTPPRVPADIVYTDPEIRE